jgi:hypothetical protein
MLPEQRMHASDRRYGRKDARRGATELTPDIGSREADAAERPAHLPRRFYRRLRRVLKLIIAGMDTKYFPGSCCS